MDNLEPFGFASIYGASENENVKMWMIKLPL